MSVSSDDMKMKRLLLAVACILLPHSVFAQASLSQPQGGTGNTSMSAALDSSFGSAQGDILFRTQTTWQVLAPGTSGFFLQTAGPGANPAWVAQTYTESVPVVWDSNTTVANATIPVWNPKVTSGTITSVTFYTGGTGTPSFTAAVQIGGTNVTGCNALSVSSSTASTTSCTGANTFGNTSQITLVISGVSGTPDQALVQINYTATAN
jgi:hypothetical protein